MHLRLKKLPVKQKLLLLHWTPFRSGSVSKWRVEASGSELLNDEDADAGAGASVSASRFELESEKSTNSEGNWQHWLSLGAAVLASGLVCLVAIKVGIQVRVNSATPAPVAVMPAEAAPEFTWQLFGYRVNVGERTPGWVYFSLLMAAGFGLFVSEEALNVWVGTTLGRTLSLGSSRELLLASVRANGMYIASTVLWVYWGVCISDMVPFYAGRMASDKFRNKFGVSNDKVEQLTSRVKRYGNLIGFVERFSLGARNPTSFLAGAAGISPHRYFLGVCAGALITLPLQLVVGVLMRKHPVKALAGVASFVGVVSILPYAVATIASLAYFMRRQTDDTRASTPQP